MILDHRGQPVKSEWDALNARTLEHAEKILYERFMGGPVLRSRLLDHRGNPISYTKPGSTIKFRRYTDVSPKVS